MQYQALKFNIMFGRRRREKIAELSREADKLHEDNLRRLTKASAEIEAMGVAEMIFYATPGGGADRRQGERRKGDK